MDLPQHMIWKALRDAGRLTQFDLAVEYKTTQGTISAFERGRIATLPGGFDENDYRERIERLSEGLGA